VSGIGDVEGTDRIHVTSTPDVLCGALRTGSRKMSHVTILPMSAKRAQGLPLPFNGPPLFNRARRRRYPRNCLAEHYIKGPFHPSNHPANSCFRLLLAYTTPTTPPPAHILSNTMSSSPLDKFNPNGDYPFMNHTKSALPMPPSPSKYPQGVPSANYVYSQKSPSPPGTQPPSPLAAPMPQYPPPQMDSSSSISSASSSPPGSGSGGIFTLYKPDGCRTPELPDILSTKKKSTWNQK
jgi:hypothetical protein